MANYATAAQVGTLVGFTISHTSRPTLTQMAVYLDNADGIINAFMKQSSNITDTYGILQVVACALAQKMVHNLLHFAEPDIYDYIDVSLTEQDEKLIRRAHSVWTVLSWEMKGPG